MSADDEMHDHFTQLIGAAGAMLYGRKTYELMEQYWPAVARDEKASGADREWARKLGMKRTPRASIAALATWTSSSLAGNHRRRRSLSSVIKREDIINSITECLRSGAAYHHCDGDGYHDEVAYRDGRYIHIDGFRSVSNPPTMLVDEHAAVALICAIHPRGSTSSEDELLQAILATLAAERP